MPTAREFAASAESMAGVRWRRHGRSPERGFDCAGLPVGCLAMLGVPTVDTRDYDALLPAPERLWAMCRANGQEQPWSDAGEGRVGLCAWRSGDVARHLVVMLSGRRIVHVDPTARGVVVVPSGWLDDRLIAVFRANGVSYEGVDAWQP